MKYEQCFAEQTRELYKIVWTNILASEEELEADRQFLAANPNFSINQVFKDLDVGQKGYLTREDLGRALNNESQALRDILFARFNKILEVESISFAEFVEEVSPKLLKAL